MGVVINARKIGELTPWGIQHYRRYIRISHEHSSALVEVNFWEVSSERCFVIHDADEVILVAILFFLAIGAGGMRTGTLTSKWPNYLYYTNLEWSLKVPQDRPLRQSIFEWPY